MTVPIKFLVTCNLNPGREEAKTALVYLTQEFTECMREAGINLSEIWYTQYGSWPQIRLVFICQDSGILRSFLESNEWYSVRKELLQHVQELKYKVFKLKDRFQF